MGMIIFKVYTCIIFKQYTCFFKGLLVKYLMVDIEIKNMEYGIWNIGDWGSVVWLNLKLLPN